MKKKIVAISFIIVIALAVVVSICLYQKLTWLKVEDQLYKKYNPLVVSIQSYISKTGCAPVKLQQLVPVHLQSIPNNSDLETLLYCRIPNGCKWELAITSTRNDTKRVYVVRSDDEYSEKELAALITNYHVVWNVFNANDYRSQCSERIPQAGRQ